ncbi:MAG: AI-2E family transporter [Oscillospiraceae bacterium]
MAKWKNWLYCGITVVIVYLFIHYWGAVSSFILLGIRAAVPLLVGCMIAYVVNILMSFYERHWMVKKQTKLVQTLRRPVCLVLSFVTVILICFLLVNMILPELRSCIRLLMKELPPVMEELIAKAEDTLSFRPDFIKELESSLKEFNWETILQKATELLTTGLGGVFNAVVTVMSSVFSFVLTLVLGLIFSLYLLTGKERLGAQCKRLITTYLKPKQSEQIFYVLRVFDSTFHKFIVGQCTEALILGVLSIVGMLLLRLPYATMIGTLIGFTALIPIAGAYIGAIVGAFMIFTVSPFQALVFLIFIVVLQELEGKLVYPKVVGKSIGLPGIWVLAAITVGGSMMGISGMLIGVPLTASIYQLLRNDIRFRNHMLKTQR